MKTKTIMLFIEWMTEVSKVAIRNTEFETANHIGQLCLDL